MTIASLYEYKFNTETTQIGPNFQNGMMMSLSRVPELLRQKVLQMIPVQVCSTDQSFDFSSNGFEFHNLTKTSPSLSDILTRLAADPQPAQSKIWDNPDLARAVEKTLSQWGLSKGLLFDQVVWVDTVYRNTHSGPFGSVHLTHVDFPSNENQATLQGHSNWKDRVISRIGPLDDDEYRCLSVDKIINIWMPLDEQVEAEPLAMMDVQSLREEDLCIYEDERTGGNGKYPSIAVKPHPSQRWYVKRNMRLGDGIIFNCCLTPHQAVTLPDQGTKSRHSLEVRVLFIKKCQVETLAINA